MHKLLYIPLQFWFCRNIGLALPLIALQYHDVELEVNFRPLNQMYTFGQNYIIVLQVMVYYIKSCKII